MKCFFFDNNISKKIVEGLKAFGEEVVHLQEKFPEDSADIEWLRYVGENGLVIITRDERVRRILQKLQPLKNLGWPHSSWVEAIWTGVD